MAFIGNNLGNVLTEARTIDTIVGDDVNTTLTLSTTPGSVNNIEVYYDGVFQSPNEDFTLLGNILTFTSAPPNGVTVVAMSGNDSQVVYPEINSVSSAKILDGVIESSKINDIAAEKISGILPALNGAAITGLNLPADVDLTTTTTNPTITENKPLGSIWGNSTTGHMFIETVATVDQHTWTNIGLGTSSVSNTSTFQGEIAGISAGGWGGIHTDHIEKFSFLSDANSVEIGNLSEGKYQSSSTVSSTHSYVQGGGRPGSPIGLDTVEKFAFETNSGSAIVSTLPAIRRQPIGVTSSTHGYACGGDEPPVTKNISKYAFSNDASLGNVGNLSETRSIGAGCNSTTHGYTAGGYYHDNVSYPYVIIDRSAFATDGTAVHVGDLNISRYGPGAASSTTHGYVAGGYVSGPGNNVNTDKIDRFAFASSVTAQEVGSLVQPFSHGSQGSSSNTHGYIGGSTASPNIQKYTYSSSSTSSDVAEQTIGRSHTAGSQY